MTTTNLEARVSGRRIMSSCRATNAKTPHEQALDAEVKAGQWLARGNELAEKGRHDAAEKAYAKATYWLDRYNKLSGRG
jgi:hypothetical protein